MRQVKLDTVFTGPRLQAEIWKLPSLASELWNKGRYMLIVHDMWTGARFASDAGVIEGKVAACRKAKMIAATGGSLRAVKRRSFTPTMATT